MRNSSRHFEPPWAAPALVRISEPAKTLLIVDADQTLRAHEAEIFCQEGYHVLQAQNAADALRVAASTAAIHLLISDFSIPEGNGLELTRRFRAVHPKTPVLMVSRSLPFLRDATQDVERVEFLTKPFAFNELLRRVRALLDAAVPLPRRKPWCCD